MILEGSHHFDAPRDRVWALLTDPAVLARARALVLPEIRRRVERLSPEVRRVAAYHLGFVDAVGRPVPGGSGKAVRPALVVLSAEAAGADAGVALPGAVAVELVHNFSLLHDDVMDGDDERRHRPTAWALFGVGPAIIAGDALLALAMQGLLDAPDGPRRRAASDLLGATLGMIAGQGEDLAFAERLDVSVEDCVTMSAHKTGALLACAASIGAVLAGAPGEMVEALSSFGMHLGLAFQAIDDVLGIWGRAAVTGKPAASDLREHKKSLPVAFALSTPGPARDRLAKLMSNGHVEGDALASAARLVERSGARERCLEVAERELALALRSIDGPWIGAAARAELEELAGFVTAREF